MKNTMTASKGRNGSNLLKTSILAIVVLAVLNFGLERTVTLTVDAAPVPQTNVQLAGAMKRDTMPHVLISRQTNYKRDVPQATQPKTDGADNGAASSAPQTAKAADAPGQTPGQAATTESTANPAAGEAVDKATTSTPDGQTATGAPADKATTSTPDGQTTAGGGGAAQGGSQAATDVVPEKADQPAQGPGADPELLRQFEEAFLF